MDKLLIKLYEDKEKTVKQMEALNQTAEDEDRVMTDDEQTKFDEFNEKVQNIDKRMEQRKKLNERMKTMKTVDDVNKETNEQVSDREGTVNTGKIELPAYAKSYQLKAFKTPETAYKFGMWIKACLDHDRAKQFCREQGIAPQWFDDKAATQQETVNTTGGYLVIPEFDSEIVDLRKEYGVFRRNAKIKTMNSDIKSRPRRTGGLTAYFMGESEAGTVSNKSWDQITLSAKKLMVLTKMSNELSEDAIIEVADDLADEIAYAFSKKEDQCGFVGTGTSSYGGIEGVTQAIGSAGVITGNYSSDYYGDITKGEMAQVIGKLPSYAMGKNPKWYCSQAFWGQCMLSLSVSASGRSEDVVDYKHGRKFLGYPVEITEALPSGNDTSGEITALFGVLSMAADFGDRRQTTLRFSEHASVDGENVFERDEIAVRGTERFDINVHDVGDSSSAGPVVAIKTG